MSEKGLAKRHVISLFIMMILCGAVISGATVISHNYWISMLTAFVMFIPVILLYASICAAFPGKNLFSIINVSFKKTPAFIINFLFTVYFFLVTSLTLRNFVEFTVVISLQDTPRLPIIFAIAAVCALIAKNGPNVIGRWSFSIVFLIAFNILFTLFASINTVKLDNLLPLSPASAGALFADGWAYGHILIGETLILTAAIGGCAKKLDYRKTFLKGLSIGMLLMLLVIFRNTMILGEELLKVAKFPSYTATRIIHLGGDLERIESLISINLLFLGVTKVSLGMYASAKGTASLFKHEQSSLFIPAVFLIVTAVTSIILDDMFSMFQFVHVYPFWAVWFQVILPVMVFVFAFLQRKKNQKE